MVLMLPLKCAREDPPGGEGAQVGFKQRGRENKVGEREDSRDVRKL